VNGQGRSKGRKGYPGPTRGDETGKTGAWVTVISGSVSVNSSLAQVLIVSELTWMASCTSKWHIHLHPVTKLSTNWPSKTLLLKQTIRGLVKQCYHNFVTCSLCNELITVINHILSYSSIIFYH